MSLHNYPSKKVEYEGSKILAVPENNLYKITKEEKCPLESCVLKEQGCGKDYAGDDISILQVSPFEISYKTTLIQGGQKEKTICVSCKNEVETMNKDDFQISQSSMKPYFSEKPPSIIEVNINDLPDVFRQTFPKLMRNLEYKIETKYVGFYEIPGARVVFKNDEFQI